MRCTCLRIFALILRLPLLPVAEPIVHDVEFDATFIGATSNDIEHFHNIHYGEDTSGRNRFHPPMPFEYTEGTIVNATTPGPACPQPEGGFPPFFDAVTDVSEDCLSLHIARPSSSLIARYEKLPVLVWIHGGGAIWGSAYDGHFSPDKLVTESIRNGKPVIWAAINYRLGIFGFTELPSMKQQKMMNNGLRDQREALLWIRSHIAAFGGDPSRITVFGQSAGATMTGLQTLSFGGEKGVPYQQVFMMSGPPGTMLNSTSPAVRENSNAVARMVGCGVGSPESVMECMQAVPMPELLKNALEYGSRLHPPFGVAVFIPSVDGDFVPDRPSILLRQGRFVKGRCLKYYGQLLSNSLPGIPSILGYTENDGSMNAGPTGPVNSDKGVLKPLSNFAASLSTEQLLDLFAMYPASGFQQEAADYESTKAKEDPSVSPHWFRLSRILRDLLFVCPAIEYTYQMYKHTRGQSAETRNFDSVRMYDFNKTLLSPMWKAVGLPSAGVSHASDINYVYDGTFLEGSVPQADQELADEFSSSLIDFATAGRPGSVKNSSPELGQWPSIYDPSVEEMENHMPDQLSILVIGGPLGTNVVSLTHPPEAANPHGSDAQFASNEFDGRPGGTFVAGLSIAQEYLARALDYSSNGTVVPNIQRRLIEHQELFRRCSLLNSFSDTLGN